MRKPPIVRTLGVLGVAVALTGTPLAAQNVPTVAVIDFDSFMMGEGGGSVQLGKALSSMLVTEFSGREGLRVLERRQLNDLLREQDLSLSGRIDDSQAIELGKMLGVQYIFTGQVTSIVENLRMDVRAIDVETTEIVSVAKRTDKTTELFSVVVSLADEFGDALNLTPPAERPQMESVPVRATIEFSRATAYEDQGETELAIQHYEATLAIHPNHRDARKGLERLRGGT
jgi:curli biogenesis system outer membrane secretion channel CsgG